ncbi:MAG TPA: translesion DNA synthesis-associated protein ImuA [Burkholderiaceae bacterium]|nr:translesion DNA synthesis-associated protein ImuA [Burkholderiaceae bacterium]
MYSIFVELSPDQPCRAPEAASLLAHTLARAMQCDTPLRRPDPPESLRDALWRAHQLGRSRCACTPSGFAALDAELPGGGWPHRALTELLVPHPGLGELRLLVPVLSRIVGTGAPAGDESGSRYVMLFDPPAALCGWALAQLGVNAQQLLVVHGREGARGAHLRCLLPSADLLWALEQALKSGHVGAVLAWLPSCLKADVLRRLQLAAQAHEGPVFLFREVQARSRPSAAPLRLLLQGAGIDRLALRVLKRRGPPLVQPLRLALPPVLGERLRVRGEARAAASGMPRVPQPAALQPSQSGRVEAP